MSFFTSANESPVASDSLSNDTHAGLCAFCFTGVLARITTLWFYGLPILFCLYRIGCTLD